jgi:hypothetical protein
MAKDDTSHAGEREADGGSGGDLLFLVIAAAIVYALVAG